MWFGALAAGAWLWGNPVGVAVAALVFAGGSIRLFGIQHDNGHNSYFTSRRANAICGVLLGAFTANAFHTTRLNHNMHHANLGNLDEMASHEVLTLTVVQWQAAGPWQRLGYRIYRSVPVICFLGPVLIVFFRYRWPKNLRRAGWWDAVLNNALMAALWGAVALVGGWPVFWMLLVGGVTTTTIGGIMVYSGHNHEDTYWQRAGDVNIEEAALKGASVLQLGPVFDFMTFNFAYHDLHHLNARIPAYRLRACHRSLSDVMTPRALGLGDALGSLRWKLWDEEKGRMVRFRDVPQVDQSQAQGTASHA